MFKEKILKQIQKGGAGSPPARPGKFFARPPVLKIVISGGLTVIISILIIYSVVKAGNLNPPAAPAATFYTLEDIYTRLTTNASFTEGNHAFAPAGSPAGTLHTLTQIYNAIPTINAAYVATTTSYLGVKGTLLGKMFNPSGKGFVGGDQAYGGVDDYNNATTTSPLGWNRYVKTWTKCTANDSPVAWCGSNDSAADYKDNSTGLIWSKPCAGSGCSSFSTTSPTTYYWSSGGANNGGYTAAQLCATVHPGWFLPHQKQFLQAYVDGAYGNLEPQSAYRLYWSATQYSLGVGGYSYVEGLAFGYSVATGLTTNDYVRCVRPAN